VQKFNQEPEKYQASELVRKDYHDQMYSMIVRSDIEVVIDLGCAEGDFLHWLPDGIVGFGIDKSEVLIERAQRVNKSKSNCHFIESNIFNLETSLPRSLFNKDISTVTLGPNTAIAIFGTLSSFLDFREVLTMLSRFDQN